MHSHCNLHEAAAARVGQANVSGARSAVRPTFPCLLQVALEGVFPPCDDCSAPCGLRRISNAERTDFGQARHGYWKAVGALRQTAPSATGDRRARKWFLISPKLLLQ